mmetsp:Transcript_7817/g.25055  ORF Transcript_7817/g.25055 Transcript_7817/m.25055 type:complete len:211 (-) Transcript_7817:28-660(-)
MRRSLVNSGAPRSHSARIAADISSLTVVLASSAAMPRTRSTTRPSRRTTWTVGATACPRRSRTSMGKRVHTFRLIGKSGSIVRRSRTVDLPDDSLPIITISGGRQSVRASERSARTGSTRRKKPARSAVDLTGMRSDASDRAASSACTPSPPSCDSSHMSMAFLRARFGVKDRMGSRVTGHVPPFFCHSSIALRSYVTPESTITGSRITS